MAVGNVGQFLVDKEVAAELERHEQLKRIGHSFIRIVYTGRHQYPRLHGFHNLGIAKEYDADTGKEESRAVMDDRVIEFRTGPDGRMTADILDDEHNRFAISRILDQVLVDNDALAKEIAALTDRKYMVEPDRKTQLMREKQRIDSELAAMGADAPAEPERTAATGPANIPVQAPEKRPESRYTRRPVLRRPPRRPLAPNPPASPVAAPTAEGASSG